MINFYLASKTIILFLIIVLVSETILGEKGAQKMIMMILFSMLILQSEPIANFANKVTENLTANKEG